MKIFICFMVVILLVGCNQKELTLLKSQNDELIDQLSIYELTIEELNKELDELQALDDKGNHQTFDFSNSVSETNPKELSTRFELFSYRFEPGESYNIMDDSANIRSEPNLDGAVIGELNIFDQVYIIENTEIEQEIENTLSYWYRIKHDELVGYVWGGYIAVKKIDYYKDAYDGSVIWNILYRYTTSNEQGNVDIRKDIAIYRNRKRINILIDTMPVNENVDDRSYLFDDCDLFSFDNKYYIYVYSFALGRRWVHRFLLGDDDTFVFSDEGYKGWRYLGNRYDDYGF